MSDSSSGRSVAFVAVLVVTICTPTAWVTTAREKGDQQLRLICAPVAPFQEEPEVIEVLVASKDLPVGTMLLAEDKPWTAKKVAKGW